jgi:hypothetical protein
MKLTTMVSVLLLGLGFQATSQNFASDSTSPADPQPVIITQDGYQGSTEIGKEKEFKDLTTRERLRFGASSVNLQFGNPTFIGLGPMVGYRLTPQLMVGVQGSYNYVKFRDLGQTFRNDVASYGAFVRRGLPFLQKIIGGGFLSVEAEQFRFIQLKESIRPSIAAGVGGNVLNAIGITVLYDFNYKAGASYNPNRLNNINSPWLIRLNAFF